MIFIEKQKKHNNCLWASLVYRFRYDSKNTRLRKYHEDNKIISKQRDYSNKDNVLIMNAHYDLGQIYLSRSSNYSKSIEYFSIILNTLSFLLKYYFLKI